jgi:ribosomal protein S18 acetylase RimI-like enzyme
VARRSPHVTLRELELEDLSAVYALGARVYRADRWPNLYRFWDEYEVVGLFQSDGETCLVAEAQGKLVGYALGMMIEKRASSWRYGYLVWLGVDPDLHRSGVGAKLIERLTELFVERGARLMVTDTAADNDPAIAFFGRQGFKNRTEHVFLTRNLTDHPSYEKRKRKPPTRRGLALPLPPEDPPDGA